MARAVPGGWNATHWHEDWVAADGVQTQRCPWCGAYSKDWDRTYWNLLEPHVGGIDRHGRCTGCGAPWAKGDRRRGPRGEKRA